MGVVLYIMLSGKVPFPGNSELEIIGNVIKGEFHFNHEPFSKHSQEVKDFLSCLIRKDVNLRYTAEQALSHNWLKENSTVEHSNENLSNNEIVQMDDTYQKIKARRACIVYLSGRVKEHNIKGMQEMLRSKDTKNNGLLTHKAFFECLQVANLPLLEREGKELMLELDP